MRCISSQSIARAYRRYAPLYDWLFGLILNPGRRHLAQALHRCSPRMVLEVGVGTGLTLPHYPPSAHIVGIDLCPEMLAQAKRRRVQMSDRAIDLYEMNAENMNFDDGAFDCVVVPYVISVTPDPHRLMSELRRVCRRGGTILILNHFRGSGWWRPLELLAKLLAEKLGFRTDLDLEETLPRRDWTIESITSVNVLGLSKLVIIRNA